MVQVDFVEYEKLDLKGYTLLEGFPGMGLVSTIAIKYIIDRLQFRNVGHIDSTTFIPVIRIHNGFPLYPSRIYVNDKLKLVAVISEQVVQKEDAAQIARSVVGWMDKKGIAKIISLEGIRTSENTKNKIYGIAANDRSKKWLEKYKINPVEEGITTGVSSLILLGMRSSKIDAISIMVNVNLTADYEASAELVKKLNEILSFNIDVEPLLKEAKETEKDLLGQLQKMKDTGEKVEKFESKATPMYA